MKLFIFVTSLLLAGSAAAEVKLSALFADHAVLQRDRQIPIWGTASPGEVVRVKLGPLAAQTTADAKGEWRAELGRLAAGGPYEMMVTGSNIIIIHDLLIGEVWLASGQSNMEIGLGIVKNAAQEFAAANHPQLRVFSVARRAAADPVTTLNGGWVVSTPETARSFTAVGYFFGTSLLEDLHVPIGIINASVGNTAAEAWTPLPELKSDPLFSALAIKQNAELRAFVSVEQVKADLLAWERQNGASDRENSGFANGFAKDAIVPDEWRTVTLPINGPALGIKGTAAVWVRKDITLPNRKYDQPANLDLGPMREADTTYFDGVKVGQAPPEPVPFDRNILYTVPASLLGPGTHTIAVRVFSHQPPHLYLGSRLSNFSVPDSGDGKNAVRIPLFGKWEFRLEFETAPLVDTALKNQPGLTFRDIGIASALYNGMISPLQNYALRGVVWYQGENNADRASAYPALMSHLIKSWREQFGLPNLPFLLVQLPNYAGGRTGWDSLRGQQEQLTKSIHDTGLAVTIDVGEQDNIHPRNKRPVGVRLALLARHRVYGESVEDTGPTYSGLSVEKDKLRIHLTHADGLHATGAVIPNFAVAGADKKFVPATAIIEGATLVLSSSDVTNPVAVRYAWTQDPEGCDVYNGANLPMPPFRTDNWELSNK